MKISILISIVIILMSSNAYAEEKVSLTENFYENGKPKSISRLDEITNLKTTRFYDKNGSIFLEEIFYKHILINKRYWHKETTILLQYSPVSNYFQYSMFRGVDLRHVFEKTNTYRNKKSEELRLFFDDIASVRDSKYILSCRFKSDEEELKLRVDSTIENSNEESFLSGYIEDSKGYKKSLTAENHTDLINQYCKAFKGHAEL